MGITPLIYESIVDMSSNSNFAQISIVQGDSGDLRQMKLTLIAQNTPYEIPQDVIVYVVGTKPDGRQVMYECEKHDTYVTFPITSQMTSTPGKSIYQVMFIDRDGNNLKSFPFHIVVTESFDPLHVKSSDDYKFLADLINNQKQETNEFTETVLRASTNAQASATASAQSAESALASANEAKSAKTYASNAKTSETNAAQSATTASNALKSIQTIQSNITQKESSVTSNASAVATNTANVQNWHDKTKQYYQNTQQLYDDARTAITEIDDATTQAKHEIDNYTSESLSGITDNIVPLASVTAEVDTNTKSFASSNSIALTNSVKTWFGVFLSQIASLHQTITNAIASIKVATTDSAGFMPKLSNNVGQYLNGKGQWVTPALNSCSGKLDATKLNGTIPLANIPQGALDRQINVADKAARLALTKSNVQNGDTVQEDDTELMYRVVDETMLGTETPEKAFKEYTAGRATYASESSMVNGHTVNADVPANAKFTDTTYNVATKQADGLCPKFPLASSGDVSKALCGDGTWKLIDDLLKNSTTISDMKASFQDGVDAVFEACVAEGITPTESTPIAIAQAIAKIRDGGNATAAQILDKQTAIVNKKTVTGTMTDNKAVTPSALACGGSYKIPKGYHNGNGVVTAQSLQAQTGVASGKTAVGASQMLTGYEGWVDGSKVTGTMANKGDVTLNTTAASGNAVLSQEIGYYTKITVNQTPAYNAGVNAADARLNTSSKSYTQGKSDGRTERQNELVAPWYTGRYNEGVTAGRNARSTEIYNACNTYCKKIADSADVLAQSGNTDTKKRGQNILTWIGKIQESIA